VIEAHGLLDPDPTTSTESRVKPEIRVEFLPVGSTSTPKKSGTAQVTYSTTGQPEDANRSSLHNEIQQWRITVSQDLTGKVLKTSAFPVAGGAYSDVSQGEFNGRMVAIKAPRIVNVPALKLAQVSNVIQRSRFRADCVR
jgi:hypothetical protein